MNNSRLFQPSYLANKNIRSFSSEKENGNNFPTYLPNKTTDVLNMVNSVGKYSYVKDLKLPSKFE